MNIVNFLITLLFLLRKKCCLIISHDFLTEIKYIRLYFKIVDLKLLEESNYHFYFLGFEMWIFNMTDKLTIFAMLVQLKSLLKIKRLKRKCGFFYFVI